MGLRLFNIQYENRPNVQPSSYVYASTCRGAKSRRHLNYKDTCIISVPSHTELQHPVSPLSPAYTALSLPW